MNKVIGIQGFARSGKDTIADYILKHDIYVHKYSFADPIKDTVAHLFDIPRDDLDGDNREEVLPQWGLSIRQILQRFGTESMRDVFGDDFWIKKAQLTLDNIIMDTLVIPDVRFENEAEFCRANGILIRVTRPAADGLVGDVGHSSELGIRDNTSDFYIYNNSSLDNLYAKIDIILK